MKERFNWSIPKNDEEWAQLKHRLEIGCGEGEAEICIHYLKGKNLQNTAETFGVSTKRVLNIHDQFGSEFSAHYNSKLDSEV